MALKYKYLHQSALKALTPGQSITEHAIVATRTKTGDIRYRIQTMVDGERIHRTIGTHSGGVRRETCERELETLRTHAREERLNLPKGRKLHRSFAEAAESYLTRMQETGGKDLANKRRHLRNYLVPFLGTDRLDKITDFRLRQYRTHRESSKATPATINRELSTFSHMMRRASSKGWQWVKPEAVPDIPKEKEARKPIQVLTVEECDRLIAASKKDFDPHTHLFVLFGLNTAMRHGEIVCRKFSDVDFATNRIWIDRAKAGERNQPITVALADALSREQAKRDDKEGWIFPASRSDSKSGHRRELGIAFRRCVEAAGLTSKACTPHVMRHTAITRLVKAGVDLLTIKRISGHKTTAMVEHYMHIHGSHIDEAVATLNTTRVNPFTHDLPKLS
ncbi:tyrosine-type recombinase/integrase [Sphingomonas sp. Mn802worker]|uniref:tyrosine-type recombinase/integrase n=1 Tax=Sphingomonas sp. Mn802worker TaxID=629773 RepID=UPI0012EAE48B|nr:site-specific integrase [Sphingomonas sp. Mn802worker]